MLPVISRTWVSIIGGCCCGILGLTNLSGFLFYLLTALLTTVVLAGKASFSPAELRKSFVTLAAVTTDGLVAGCMSYVLFWTSVDTHWRQTRTRRRIGGQRADATKEVRRTRRTRADVDAWVAARCAFLCAAQVIV